VSSAATAPRVDRIVIQGDATGRVWAKCPDCDMRWEAWSHKLLVTRIRACADLDRRTRERRASQDGLEHCSGDVWAGVRRRQRGQRG
jgi:hypothetical protein